MSTLPGLASKGEKGKAKFQSLDINHLYKVSRGESVEKQQQKSNLPLKHGMQSLGRLPSARRPPANLPSIKSEHSGTDAAVSLVPSGGPGWGKQESSTPLTTTTLQTPTTPTSSSVSSPSSTNTTLTPHQAAIALPVSTAVPPPAKHATSAVPATTDKSWSSVMASNDLLHPPPYQSPQFQHEFPSLSAGEGAVPRPGIDTQYGPGPSLRPQTEGSWMQGGSRTSAEMPPRSSSAPLGAPPQLSAQVGLQQALPPQFQGILPGFMFRGNPTPNGHGTSIANMPSPMLNANRNRDGRPPLQQQQPRAAELEDMARRPIIKEEDLNRMDDMTKDMGWAAQDEIDYNQKLAFSDEESTPDKASRKIKPDRDDKIERQQESEQQKGWNRATSAPISRRSTDEDEILAQKRRQQHQVIVNAAERAKQRKEEEEKKLKSKQREKEQEEANAGSIQPAGCNVATHDWEKEKERAKSDEEKMSQNKLPSSHDNDFRQLTSIEGRSFIRKEARGGDNRNGSGYSRQMQNLPPRLQKKQQMRNNPSPQPPLSYASYDSRWQPNQNLKPPVNQRSRNDWDEGDKDDKIKYDEMRRRPYSDSGRKSELDRFEEYSYRKEKDEKWEKKDKFAEKEEIKYDNSISRHSSEEWHNERHTEKYEKIPERYDRPQRPDSRDSRTSRDSRHSRDSARDSEPREHLGSWAESITYDEKRKEREDRRPIPGPITKEKIEADEKQSEKRNLTQLKKGNLPEKKLSDIPDEKDRTKEVAWNNNQNQAELISDSKPLWADSIPTAHTDIKSTNQEKEKSHTDKSEGKDDSKRSEAEISKEKEEKQRPSHPSGRNRPARSQGWDRSGPMFHNYKKARGSRLGRPSSKMGDFRGTDSEESMEDNTVNDFGKDDRGMQRSPKPVRKNEKDEKNRDVKNDKAGSERKIDKYLDNKKESYEPRGEPSRHGRGGGNIRGRGGLSKRIDGYGPPPSKSPFGHTEEKDKKPTDDVHLEVSHFDLDNKGQNSAGVIGSTRKEHSSNMRGEKKHDDKYERNKPRRDRDGKKSKPKLNENGDTSDHSDDSVNKGRKNKSPIRNRGINQGLRRNAPPRLSCDKRGPYNPPRGDNPPTRQNSNGSLRSVPTTTAKTEIKEEKSSDLNNALCNAIADISLNIKEQEEQQVPDGEMDDHVCNQGDSDGFQEVKSKKNVNKGPKALEDKPLPRPTGIKPEAKPIDRKPKQPYPLSQQQIANIPSLMETPINPPSVIPQPNKGQYDRNRHKLPPRLAKQRENSRLQKAQLQGICDMNDLNKVNQSMNMYGLKDGSSNIPATNAWEKPLSQFRGNMESEMVLPVVIENCKSIDQPHSPAQNSSPNSEKIIGKNSQIQDKSVLDGSTPPVNTIIFENTNYKSAPGVRSNRTDKPRSNKMEENSPIDNSTVMSTFNKPVADLLNKSDNKQSDIQMQLSFNKEDTTDMKLDFFDSDISHLTEDKGSKNISLPRSMHAITSSNSTMSPSTADLNFKIASVKKVWDNTMPPVIEHSVSQEETSTFSSSFGPDPNSLDPSSAFSKAGDGAEDTHEGYSPSPSQSTANNTTNVCKVKPTQQVPGTTGQNIAGGHQPHSGIITMPPLSSPPIQPVIGPSIGLNQPPQQYTANQHLGYQAGLGGSTQFGMPAIPSPPNVLYNSTQQLQPNLYGGFPMDQLGGQRTSQFSQYPYSLGQNASSHYSAQSLYLQTQPHPPPTAQAPPDLYQSIANYRLQNAAPYGQSQQLNNPTTVLISSTSNSLMSASVKPSNQQISAIGTKTGTVGQTYQQQSQQGQQLYMTYDPSLQPNYLPNTGVMQRAPTGPVQNNVLQALQPSSSYYSGSTGGQTGYFQQPGSSTLQSGPLQQHQASYGMQSNVFGTHSQSHSSPNMPNISSHYLSQMQFAAAMNVQQFRNQNMQNASYLKGIGAQQVGDQTGRSQQLKSPGNQQEVLSSVFNSGPQIPSPKSRQNCKQPPPQPSPTTQHKYNLYQGVGNQQSSQTQRYPTPIQRPQMTFQPNLNSVQNSGPNNPKHRASNAKGPSRNYYSSQSSLSSQNDKAEENKLGDHGTQGAGTVASSVASSAVSKANMGGGVNKAEIAKEKEDPSAIKD